MPSTISRRPRSRRSPITRPAVRLLSSVVLLLLTHAALPSSAGAAVAPCGGEGQRACCLVEGAACRAGLLEVVRPNSGLCAPEFLNVQSNGVCLPVTACGRKGQRACCAIERPGKPCDAGLIEVPGCSGDCTCGSGRLSGTSSGMCTVIEPIAEPVTGWTAAAQPAPSLRGYADIHLHLFGHMGHGGAVLAGKPYDAAGGVNETLRPDYGTNLDLVTKDGGSVRCPQCPGLPQCPSFLPRCGSALFHGDHTLFDTATGVGTQDAPKSNLGAPLFNGWPTWRSTVHQQAYHRWLERAWRGGLRLVTVLAVTNEALCRSSRHVRGTVCDDSMAAIDAQLEEARRFERFVDDLAGGAGKGWFRIVLSPEEARQVIRDGKLAAVLGIEVDNLFHCKLREGDRKPGQCTPEGIRRSVDELYARGVRHVFPIHNFDNAFGGAATWQTAIAVGNRAVEGEWWQTENCPGGFGFKLDTAGNTFMSFLMNLFGFGGVENVPIRPGDTTSCNQRTLSPLGEVLVRALMDRGILIDVDHMSIKALDRTLDLAEQRVPPYPIVASHVQFFDLNKQEIRHERMRTRAQLERIRRVGGMVAAMLKDDVQDTDRAGQKMNVAYRPPSGGIGDDCRHSSKTFAQMLQYAVDVMGGPVALGSDFNGVAGHVGPRFGSDACGGYLDERLAQIRARNRLQYPVTVPGFGTFDRQVTGHKTFDFNVDGLTHAGLLPDLVADLRAIGLPERYLDSLFNSAAAYVDVWERATRSRPR
jgi:microsomal dipeptidase-like Zn-dependent dipeptidase